MYDIENSTNMTNVFYMQRIQKRLAVDVLNAVLAARSSESLR